MRHCTARTRVLMATVAVLSLPGAMPLRSASYGQLPLSFEANRGQADTQVLYLARGPGYGLFLSRNSATLRLINKSRVAELRMRVAGATTNPMVEGTEPLSGATHYYRGQDPRQWIADAPTFGRVRYSGVYPGVDLVFYGNQGSLEYDFVVAPGANPRAIALTFDGASRAQIDSSGDLLLSVPRGQVRLLKPVAYQEIAGVRRPVVARYHLSAGRVGFTLGSYDTNRPLIVDPILNYSSYLGGNGLDGASAIAVDPSGNAYIAGWTASGNFPTTFGAYQPGLAGLTDAFVAKIDPLGETRLYCTFLGGAADDTAEGIAVDAAGNAYVVGSTQSANFPTLNPLQSYGGGGDGFIAKLNSSGKLTYSTYLGGNATEDARAVAVDTSGNAYIAGVTGSSNFPVTAGAYQLALGGASDAFVVKLNAAGSAATYSTYLGGSGTDEANAIAVDGSGNAWVAGLTWSSTFPSKNPLQAYAGSEDGFVAKINPAGTGLLFSTFLGGNSLDLVTAIAVDGNGNAYAAGSTGSANFPVTSGVLQPAQGGSFPDEDAFVVKYNSAGTQVLYSTYLGGSNDDIAYALTVDSQGYAYVAGETASSNFPVLNGLRSYGGGEDAFVTVLNANATALVFSTFLGGAADDRATGIAVDANGRIYVAGETSSNNFPVIPASGALQASPGGGIEDAFLAAMQFCSYTLNVTGSPFSASGGTGSLVISAAAGCLWSAASTVSWITLGTPSSGSGNGTVSFTVAPNSGALTLIGALTAGWQSVPVTESGITCTYTLGAMSATATAAGGSASFTVTPSSSGCTWTATSNTSWITVTGGSPGTGPGTVTYSAAPTTSINQRSGTITAAGQTFTVNQQSGTATFSLNPTSAAPGSAGGTSSVAVMCNLTDAPWTASSNSPWLTIASGASGTGSGSVGYSVAVNTSANSRSGSLTIAGLTFPVTQSGTNGLPPTLTITKGHTGNFFQGEQSATYTVAVLNAAGTAATSGAVTVSETIPTGLALVSMSGTGWNCPNTCTRSDALNPGSSYPAITVTVNVSSNAPSQVTNQVTVSGGGSVSANASDMTTITPVSAPPSAVTVFSPSQGATGVSTAVSLTWGAATGATSYDVYFGTTTTPGLATNTIGLTYTPGPLSPNTIYFWSVTAKNAFGSTPSTLWYFTTGIPVTTGLGFVPVTPCRVMDTRAATGTFGGPSIAGGATRSVPIPLSSCNIPSNAQAYSLNITVVPPGPLSYLTIWPTGQSQPVVSTLNSLDGRIVANAAIVPAGVNGAVSVFVSNTTDVIIDINGYFAPASSAGSLSFYSATPCRVADTRNGTGPFAGPFMSGGSTRSFTIPSSVCGIPTTAQAYSLNITVAPHGTLGYLTAWPTGQSQPVVSTLNSLDGSVVANAAIVPAGSSGGVSVYVTNDTDVIIDINGYFAPSGSNGALLLYTLTPCRVADTRGTAGAFGGPALAADATRSFTIPSSSCSVPSTAQAYSLNVTAVPPGPLTYLTAWPAGQNQPIVSTLNSFTGKIVANAAIVPAGSGGAVSVFVSNTTDVILDINAYFAP